MTILELEKTSVPGSTTNTPKKFVQIGCCYGEKDSTLKQTSKVPESVSSRRNGSPETTTTSTVDSLHQYGSVPSLAVASGDSCDDTVGGGEGLRAISPSLWSVLHDHGYMEKLEWTVSSVSPADGSSLDESLQNLFDNCDVDPVFLAEAKPAFQQFLDDVMNSSDVPDDVMFFNVDDRDCRVPTKSSSCLTGAPSAPCLFTCAGSTETRLSTSVRAVHGGYGDGGTPSSLSPSSFSVTSPTSQALTLCVWSSAPAMSPVSPQLAGFGVGTSLPCSLAFSSSSSTSYQASPPLSSSSSSSSELFPSTSDISSVDKELLDALSSLAPGSDCVSVAVATQSALTSTDALTNVNVTNASDLSSAFPVAAGDILCNTQQQLWGLDDSVPVTMFHRIQNGVCVFCSPVGSSTKDVDRSPRLPAVDPSTRPARHDDENNNNDSDSSHFTATNTSPTPAGHVQLSSCHPSVSTVSSACSRKRQSEEEEECVASLTCKRAKLEDGEVSPSSGFTSVWDRGNFRRDSDVVLSSAAAAANELLLSSLRPREKTDVTSTKRSRVLDCLSFVVAQSDEKLSDFHPLSPINVNQFGRCG